MDEHSEPRKLPEPKFSQSHVVRGRLLCQICFKGCEKRYLKREHFQKLQDVQKFKTYAELWELKDHEYNTVNKHVKWTLLDEGNEIWAHKQCKGKFFKDNYLSKQTSLPTNEESVSNDIDGEIESSSSSIANTPDIRQSSRKKYTYESSWKDKEIMKCIICNEEKRKKGRPLPLTVISVTEKAEKTLK